MRWFRIAFVAFVPLGLAGCVSSMLARQVVTPPNQSGAKAMFSDSQIVKSAPTAFSQVGKVGSGPPAADIAFAVIEPGEHASGILFFC